MLPSLCRHCRSIDFTALRGPSLSEINDLYAGRNAAHIYGSKSDDTTSRINLGTLERIKKDASCCGLCGLFAHIIERQGAVGYSNRDLSRPDVCFVATAGAVSAYYGSIGTVVPFQALGFLLQRLTVTAHENTNKAGYGDCLAYLTHALHAQRPGSNDVPVRGKSYEACEASGTMLFGARSRALQLDIGLLRSWIDICSNEHVGICSARLGKEIAKYPVRFVDVKQRCIVTFSDKPLGKIRYIALSYVWGHPKYQRTKLLKENVQQLGRAGSLTTMQVPQTIEDAIELTKLLGFDYVWVDALCIIQDDAGDQQIQINNMHGVYKTAFATIVAASGEHSDAGLPGLRAGTRRYEQRSTIVVSPTNQDPGMSLVTSVKSLPQSLGSSWTVGHGDIDTSVWNRRAWTMQEKALSRRTITFSEEQVSWDCPCASFSEEAFFEIRNLRCRSITSTSYQDLTVSSLSPKKSPWDLYRNLVDRFSQRDLSYPGDYNDAFAAIIEMFTDTTGEKFVWALPCSRFNLSLSWDTIYGVYRRSAVSKLAMTSLNRRIQFPSWSWLGWVGHAHCSVGTDRTECETPTIVCYTNRSNPLSFHALQDPATSAPHSQTCSVAFSNIETHLPNLTAQTLSTFADEYLLFFWANTARFLMRPPNQLTFTDHENVGTNVQDSRPTVHNTAGACIGTACRLKSEHWALAKGGFNEQWYDFVAVSRRAVREIPEYPATIIALQIEWVGSVAYRVNIAEIGEEDWIAAGPVGLDGVEVISPGRQHDKSLYKFQGQATMTAETEVHKCNFRGEIKADVEGVSQRL